MRCPPCLRPYHPECAWSWLISVSTGMGDVPQSLAFEWLFPSWGGYVEVWHVTEGGRWGFKAFEQFPMRSEMWALGFLTPPGRLCSAIMNELHGTASPNKLLLLQTALVMVCHHSDRELTNTLWQSWDPVQQDPSVNKSLKEEKQRPPPTSVLEEIYLFIYFGGGTVSQTSNWDLLMDHKSNLMPHRQMAFW